MCIPRPLVAIVSTGVGVGGLILLREGTGGPKLLRLLGTDNKRFNNTVKLSIATNQLKHKKWPL